MKVKKNNIYVLFLDILYAIVFTTLVTISFFLGFDITKNNVIVFLLIILSIVITCVIIYFSYSVLCKSYYVFEEDRLLYVNKSEERVLLEYIKIRQAEYYKFYNLLIGDPRSGKLIVYYQENDEEKRIEIPMSFKTVRKLPFGNILKN